MCNVLQKAAATELARIGNRESASRMPPLKKELYTEHAEVHSLSASAVSEWQAERDISVENCSLRPILEFKHTGRTTCLA